MILEKRKYNEGTLFLIWSTTNLQSSEMEIFVGVVSVTCPSSQFYEFRCSNGKYGIDNGRLYLKRFVSPFKTT